MLRLYYVITINFFVILFLIPAMSYYARHSEKYDENFCYGVASWIARRIKRTGHISTLSHGVTNLPEKGGYIMFANHQGRYDTIGIIASHEKPCTMLAEMNRSHTVLFSQFLDMLHGKRIDQSDPRQGIKVVHEIASEVIEGKRYLIYPEGGYDDNKNTLQRFNSGIFLSAIRAKCPIVPVVLYDSYKPFTQRGLKKVTTQIFFLEPINYADYATASSSAVRDMVERCIEKKLEELTEEKKQQDS